VKKSEPVLDVEFVQLLQDMIGDLSGGAPEPIAVKLFSDSPDVLKEWAPHVGDALMNITINSKKPIVDIEDGIENTTSGPAVTFNISPERLARAGFAADDLEIVTSAIMDGEPTSQPVIVNERPYTLRIRYPASSRSSLEAVSNTMLVNSTGATATLGSLTGITEEPGQTEVLRENLQRVVTVTARLEGIDLGTAIKAVQKTVADLKLPPSIRVEYGGIYAEQQKSFRDLVTVLVLAIVLIFLVLLFEFRSYSAPIAILSSAVLSTSGVCFALLITRTEFNVSSFMGLIMVVGIVAKNGILLLDANHKYLDAGMSVEEAMVQAGRRRLRPIVMTAMAAVAGMLPLALAIGAGSQMLQPLAIAVIGGITISMVLSLIITPAIQYYLTRA
jgi:multidrug efflux pump subunit AcrB